MFQYLKTLRNKLSSRDKRYFELAVWAALVVWMVSYVSIALITAQVLHRYAIQMFEGSLGNFIGYIWAVALVMTVLYTLYLLIRWVNKEFKGVK